MKLRLSLRNSAKDALSSNPPHQLKILLPILLILTLLLPALSCNPNTSPTYTTENIVESLTTICKKEFSIRIVVNLAKQTLYVYLPLEEEIFIESDKPQEYLKLFEVTSIESSFHDDTISFGYNIKAIPEAKEAQNKKINPLVSKKMQQVFSALRRVLFSLKHSEDGPKFFIIATADIKNGVEILETTYIDDFRKVLYGMLSWTEYQHRSLQDIKISLEAIGDLEGKHLEFRDVDFSEFLVEQIKQRLRIKFNRPEVEKGADIDREVLKSIKNVLEIYNFKEVNLLELNNLVTNNKVYLSRAALLDKIRE